MSSAPVPEGKVIEFVQKVQKTEVVVSIEKGQEIIKDLLDLGIDLISSH